MQPTQPPDVEHTEDVPIEQTVTRRGRVLIGVLAAIAAFLLIAIMIVSW